MLLMFLIVISINVVMFLPRSFEALMMNVAHNKCKNCTFKF